MFYIYIYFIYKPTKLAHDKKENAIFFKNCNNWKLHKRRIAGVCYIWNQMMVNMDALSVLGWDKEYSVKYSPLPEGVPKWTPKVKGPYLTVYPELSRNMESIIFLCINMSVLSSKVGWYWKSWFSVFLSLGGQYFTLHSLWAIFHSILPRVNNGCSAYWEIPLSKRAILKE